MRRLEASCYPLRRIDALLHTTRVFHVILFLMPFKFIAAVSTLLLIGYLGGRIVTLLEVPDATPMHIDHVNIENDVPVVELRAVQNGMIAGELRGDARLFAHGEQILPDASGAIVIPVSPFLTQYVDVLVPEGAAFVASRRGKKYYPVGSAAGDNLSPQNRIYFRSAEEAERAGYRK